MNENDRKAIEEGCYYDPVAADKACRFLEKYYIHTTINKPITLLPWQRYCFEQFFGWKRKHDNVSRWQKGLISTAKKNGKTLFAGGVIKYSMYGEISKESKTCISCSTSRENATYLYDEIAHSVRQNRGLNKISKLYESRKQIRVISRNAKYFALSADSGSVQGVYAKIAVVDENHAHPKDAKLYRAIEGSTISSGGTTLSISTAGGEHNHWFKNLFDYALQVQNDEIIDTGFFPYICTPKIGADLDNPETWKAANPSLDCNDAFTTENFKRDLERHKNSDTGSWITFQRYHLNTWILSEDNYISADDFDKCEVEEIPEEQLLQYPLYVGVDASTVSDPSSISLVWTLPNRRYYVKCFGWVCEEGVKKRSKESPNLTQYQTFVQDGCFKITPGETINHVEIQDFILKLKRYKLKEVVFDMNNVLIMGQQLRAKGINVFQMPQTHKYFNDPVKQFEIAIKEGRILHDGKQSWLRNSLLNAKLDIDNYGSVKLSRSKSNEKIDGAISSVQGFGRAMMEEVNANKVCPYENRGLIFV